MSDSAVFHMEHAGLSLAHEQWDKLDRFLALLLAENARLGLVSPKTANTLEGSLLSPCLHFSRLAVFSPPTETVVDLGSGNGFPGIVLALLNPHLKVLLVDSQLKRCQFLEQAVNWLSLSQVEVLHARIEKLRSRAAPDIFTSWFFKDVRLTAAWTRHWRTPGTRYVFFAGASIPHRETVYNLILQAVTPLTPDKVALEYLTV